MSVDPAGFILRLAIAVGIGIALEFLNGVLSFLLPPLIVILPICIALGVVAGLRKRTR